jgi:hypothetical protein
MFERLIARGRDVWLAVMSETLLKARAKFKTRLGV